MQALLVLKKNDLILNVNITVSCACSSKEMISITSTAGKTYVIKTAGPSWADIYMSNLYANGKARIEGELIKPEDEEFDLGEN